LRVKKIKERIFAIDGTPADCVYLALKCLLPEKPHLLISGINQGANLGQQDICYSGTVAAAIQGTFLGIPSLAFSSLPDEGGKYRFDFSAKICRQFAIKALERDFLRGITFNINIPPPPIKGIKLVKLGEKRYNPEIIQKTDPRKNVYFWIGDGSPTFVGDEGSDVVAIKQGFITVSPLKTDFTAYRKLKLNSLKKILVAIEDEIS